MVEQHNEMNTPSINQLAGTWLTTSDRCSTCPAATPVAETTEGDSVCTGCGVVVGNSRSYIASPCAPTIHTSCTSRSHCDCSVLCLVHLIPADTAQHSSQCISSLSIAYHLLAQPNRPRCRVAQLLRRARGQQLTLRWTIRPLPKRLVLAPHIHC